ncbi:hypothetical protein BDV10DRAFT_70194 [Aspergillus recurvatus]
MDGFPDLSGQPSTFFLSFFLLVSPFSASFPLPLARRSFALQSIAPVCCTGNSQTTTSEPCSIPVHARKQKIC